MKEPEENEIQELRINSIKFCDYLLEGDHIFIKTREQIHDDKRISEDCLIAIISIIHQTKIKKASYLNI